jgi:hypothetical protein
MSVDQDCIVQAVHDVQFQQLHDDLLGIVQRAGFRLPESGPWPAILFQ